MADETLDFDPLSIYFREISHINHLSKEEEIDLARKGNKEAIDELVYRNLKYVVTIANKYKGCGLSLSDLINEGNIGMINAANRFNPNKGVKFITYAIWWIRQSIIQALAYQAGTVKLPIKQAGVLYRISEIYRQYYQEHQREPSVREISSMLGIKASDIEAILRVYRSTLSLDTNLKDSDETSYLDLLEDTVERPLEEDINKEALVREIKELMKILPPREKNILKMRFGLKGDPMTLDEIGKKMGLSRERIRQLEKKAKGKLLEKARDRSLRDFLT